jgi:homogentisate 1,2-dioxygenase
MSHYVRRGEVPPKRHVQFRAPGGELRYEELVSRQGFSGVYSNLYHLSPPTQVLRLGPLHPLVHEPARHEHRARHLRSGQLASGGDAFEARRLLFFNDDVLIHKAHADRSMASFFRHGAFDELVYVQAGRGELQSMQGVLGFGPGDYLIIPRGTTYRLALQEPSRLLVVESRGALATPSRYRNSFGQLLEHSPYCERDLREPELRAPEQQKGEFLVRVRVAHGIQEMVYGHHPFDLVGWDGYLYPWAFSIHDFEPITGRLHQPPPVHQTFEAPGVVVCSFVPRILDYHPQAIPAPYPHSNVDSDEVIFYSAGEFTSRKGIEAESLTLHPMGFPHGPQPGRYEQSIGKHTTEELAVMIDTFAPLEVASSALQLDDGEYALSWSEAWSEA